jgi:hypothetical protein
MKAYPVRNPAISWNSQANPNGFLFATPPHHSAAELDAKLKRQKGGQPHPKGCTDGCCARTRSTAINIRPGQSRKRRITWKRVGDEQHPSEVPSARCLARMEKYSKARYTSGPDFSTYTDVITEFYTKHPEYQGIPFMNLMKWLSDRNHKTADDLYQMALKGEMRPVR